MTEGIAKVTSGVAPVRGASIYYEAAGRGPAVALIHAGVADSRMWNGTFEALAVSMEQPARFNELVIEFLGGSG
jgi:hypothetical protein